MAITFHLWQSPATGSRSSREKTVPVGLLGLQMTIALVLLVKGRRQLVGIEPPVRRPERNEPRLRAGDSAVGPVILVERLREDHFVAGIDQRNQRDQHRLGAAAGDGDLGFGIDLEPEMPSGMFGDRLAQVLARPR